MLVNVALSVATAVYACSSSFMELNVKLAGENVEFYLAASSLTIIKKRKGKR